MTVSLSNRPYTAAATDGRRHPKQVGNINLLVIDTADHADALQLLNERLFGNLGGCKRQRMRRQIEALVIDLPVGGRVRRQGREPVTLDRLERTRLLPALLDFFAPAGHGLPIQRGFSSVPIQG